LTCIGCSQVVGGKKEDNNRRGVETSEIAPANIVASAVLNLLERITKTFVTKYTPLPCEAFQEMTYGVP